MGSTYEARTMSFLPAAKRRSTLWENYAPLEFPNRFQEVGHLIYISGRMFAHLIGLKQPRFVTGYSSPELDVAIEQGEIDTRSTVLDALVHEKPHWVDKRLMDFHALIEVPKGRKHPNPALPISPTSRTLPGRPSITRLSRSTGVSSAAVTR